jgi:hypothetical protein
VRTQPGVSSRFQPREPSTPRTRPEAEGALDCACKSHKNVVQPILRPYGARCRGGRFPGLKPGLKPRAWSLDIRERVFQAKFRNLGIVLVLVVVLVLGALAFCAGKEPHLSCSYFVPLARL